MTVPTDLDRRFRDAADREGLVDVAYDLTDSPVGELLVATTDRGALPDRLPARRCARRAGRRLRRARPPHPAPARPRPPRARRVLRGPRREFDLELDLSPVGSFHLEALHELARVPYGQVTTYGALAKKVGHPHAARAIGGAMNRNPIPIVLPCHRVVGSTGKLVGYAGGLDRKELLLKLEGAMLDTLFP